MKNCIIGAILGASLLFNAYAYYPKPTPIVLPTKGDPAVWRLILQRETGTDIVEVLSSDTLLEFTDEYIVFEALTNE